MTDSSSHQDQRWEPPRKWLQSTGRYNEEHLLDNTIKALQLEQRITDYLRQRYLDYLCWLEDGATDNLRLYYALRIPILILAAVVPALVALDLGTVGRTITVALSVAVAAGTAIDHFLNSGQRWRHYRAAVELMKSELWLYLELAGVYATYQTHSEAFLAFVTRAEGVMQSEVREYVTTIVAEQGASDKINHAGRNQEDNSR